MSNGSEHIAASSTLDGATTEPEPGVESNPGEFAVVWNRHTEEERAEMLRTMREGRDRSERCWFDDHERQIAEQRSRIAALEAVIRQAQEFDGQQTVNGVTDQGYLSPEEWRSAQIDRILDMAPSTVLDGMIREAKAEARAVQPTDREELFQLWSRHGSSFESDSSEGYELADALLAAGWRKETR